MRNHSKKSSNSQSILKGKPIFGQSCSQNPNDIFTPPISGKRDDFEVLMEKYQDHVLENGPQSVFSKVQNNENDQRSSSSSSKQQKNMFLLNLNLVKRRNKYSKFPDNHITTVEMSPQNSKSPGGDVGEALQVKSYLRTDESSQDDCNILKKSPLWHSRAQTQLDK